MKTTKPKLANDELCKADIDTQKNKKLVFNLADASVHGVELLISEPRKWQQLEDEYIASSFVIPAKAGIHSC